MDYPSADKMAFSTDDKMAALREQSSVYHSGFCWAATTEERSEFVRADKMGVLMVAQLELILWSLLDFRCLT
jgi:hypothetical protein